jgi:hypothetical protein
MPRQEPNLYLYPFLPQTVFQVSGRRAQISDSSAGFATTTKPESQGQVLPLIPVEDSRSLPKFVSEVCTNNQTVPVDRCLSTKIHDQSLLEESVRAVANSRSLPPFERAVPSTLALSQATYDSNIRMLLLLREEQAQAEAFEQTRVQQQLLLEANLLIGWRSERQSVWFEDGNCNRGHDCEMRLANDAAYQQQLSPQFGPPKSVASQFVSNFEAKWLLIVNEKNESECNPGCETAYTQNIGH